jgi:hypothetical protein
LQPSTIGHDPEAAAALDAVGLEVVGMNTSAPAGKCQPPTVQALMA